MADHFAWKGPFEAVQKWFQQKLNKDRKIHLGDLNSWNKIIKELRLLKL
jgi:hypothetical protein